MANENSFQGFVRVLGFRSLGRLTLTVHPPSTVPRPTVAARAGARPGAPALAHPPAGRRGLCRARQGTVTVRLHHLGLPLDAVLSTGLPSDSVADLRLPKPAGWAPRLYAGFGGGARGQGGVPVPDRLRPSPLEYIVRVLGDASWTEPVSAHLAARRFEFLDFDVV